MSGGDPKILTVTFADAPRDVLVHLVEVGPSGTRGLVDAVAIPAGADEPETSVRRAIALLMECDCVDGRYDANGDMEWFATPVGIQTVRAARAGA